MVPAYSMLGKSVLQRCTSIPVVVCFLSGTLLIFNNGSCIFNVYVVVVSAFPLLCYFSRFFCFFVFFIVIRSVVFLGAFHESENETILGNV